MINAERLEQLDTVNLGHGAHASAANGMCALEAVAWLANEPHSDRPQCACPVISAIVRNWNDALPNDEARNRLIRPLLTKIVGTRASGAPSEQDSVLLKRMFLVQDWHIRVRAPAFLKLAGLTEQAEALESLPVVVDNSTLEACVEASSAAESAADSAAESAARSAAYSAAYSAALSAARSAAYSAAYSAAESAARSAAYSAAYSAALSAARSAAYSAAESAALSAADSAAYSAALSAAESKLAETLVAVQASFVDLIVRMCEVTS